ncbi:SDR family NAD(P)-dependent oxidoreductase [Nocardia sp. NPDC058058]|uniref:SDR family NAD(P)-dependent oxidoreductase n=1 Tax=Nocardia sp. NPDC058058 TaxID=3346317 RepID=UPI0036DD86B9
MKTFQPRLAVVTGAGSGIGRGTAKALADRGATVIVADINFATAKDTAALIHSHGGQALPYALDVADPVSMEGLADYVRAAHGVPDVVVNNAGIVVGGPFFDIRPADLQRIVDVNLTAVVQGCRLFGAQMAERGTGGQLVNVSSVAAFAAMRLGTPYAFTAAGVKHLSETLRVEMAPLGIGVTVVCPGLIATNLAATASLATLSTEQVAITRQIVVKGMTLLGMHPDKAGRKIVEAAAANRAMLPLRLESRLIHLFTRAFPNFTRALMRVGTGPEVERAVRFVIDHPGFVGIAREAAELMPQRPGLQTYWEPPEYDDPPPPPIPLRR